MPEEEHEQVLVRDVLVPARLTLSDDRLVVAASIDFTLSQFGVSGDQGIFTVADDAAFEFELLLGRGG